MSEAPTIPPFWKGGSLSPPASTLLRGDTTGPLTAGTVDCAGDNSREVSIVSGNERLRGLVGERDEIDGVKVSICVGDNDALKDTEDTGLGEEEEGRIMEDDGVESEGVEEGSRNEVVGEDKIDRDSGSEEDGISEGVAIAESDKICEGNVTDVDGIAREGVDDSTDKADERTLDEAMDGEISGDISDSSKTV